MPKGTLRTLSEFSVTGSRCYFDYRDYSLHSPCILVLQPFCQSVPSSSLMVFVSVAG